MFCRQCGVRNEEGSRFCESCGTKLAVVRKRSTSDSGHYREKKTSEHLPSPRRIRSVNENKRAKSNRNYDTLRSSTEHKDKAYRGSNRNRKKKQLISLGLGVLLLVAILLAGWMFMNVQNTRAFNDAMEEGNRYLLAENLEQAEAYFLRAIEISPREVEPYLALADIYMRWDQPEDAIAILEQGLEAVPERERPALEEALDEIRESEAGPPIHEGESSELVEADGEAGNEANQGSDLTEVQSALVAYREFLMNPQSMEFDFAGLANPISWDVNAIRHAQLVDFDNNGIPELVLAIRPSSFDRSEHYHHAGIIMVLKYRDGIELLYSEIRFYSGGVGSSFWNRIAIREDGGSYLASSYFDAGMGRIWNTRYYALINGEFEFSWVLRSEQLIGSGGDAIFYVNDVEVSGEEFDSAPANRGIMEERAIWENSENRDLWGTSFDIQPLLAYIDRQIDN